MSTKGFTLVELAIVITILGFVVAAVAGGRALVKQARINSVVSDLHGFSTAINAFVMEFEALPGDFDEAEFYWQPVLPDDNEVFDGNNDRKLTFSTGPPAINEHRGFWHHLSLSGNIPDLVRAKCAGGTLIQFTGGCPPVPVSSIAGAVYTVNFNDQATNGNTDLHIILGKVESAGADETANDAALTVREAIALDKKMDDGQADSGDILADTGINPVNSCITGSDYSSNSPGVNCRMGYLLHVNF